MIPADSPPAGIRSFSSALAAVATLVALAAGAVASRPIWELVTTSDRLPLWDMAGHAWGGVELLESLASGRPLALLTQLNAQDKWPFGFSLLLLPSLALGGKSVAAATVPALVAFATVPALLVLLAWRIDRSATALLGGLGAGALWLAAPLPRLFAALVMRETTGAALILLVVLLELRAAERGSLAAWRASGVALLALVLVKYNYALVVVVGLALHRLLALPAARRRELASGLWRRLWPLSSGERRTQAMAALLVALGLCMALRINPGVALWVLLLGGAIRAAVVAWRRRRSPFGWVERLAPRERALVETVALPLGFWWLSPQPIHPRTVWAFLVNRPGDGSIDPGFYFAAFARGHAATAALGWTVLAAAGLFAVLAFRSTNAGCRALALVGGVGFAMVALHPYHEPRFLTPVVPLLMLAGTLAPLALARRLARESATGLSALASLAAMVACGALAWASLSLVAGREEAATRLAIDYSAHSGDPRLAEPLGALVEAAMSTGKGHRRVAFLGMSNELSPNLLRWRIAQAGQASVVNLVDGPARSRAARRDRPVDRRLGDWLAKERPERVLALAIDEASAIGASRDYREQNAWQAELVAAMEEAPAWRLSGRRAFPELGLELRVYDRAALGLTLPRAAVTLPGVLRLTS